MADFSVVPGLRVLHSWGGAGLLTPSFLRFGGRVSPAAAETVLPAGPMPGELGESRGDFLLFTVASCRSRHPPVVLGPRVPRAKGCFTSLLEYGT